MFKVNMGGYGSSRWHGCTRKRQVEECSVFDLDAWISAGLLQHMGGRIEWIDPYTGGKNSLRYFLRSTDVPDCKYVETFYQDATGKLQYEPAVIVSKPQKCGVRWYFFCWCGRRVRKLYSVRTGGSYRCRHCRDLTYGSAQEHNKNHDVFRRNPDYLMRALNAGYLQATFYVVGNLMRLRTPSRVHITPIAKSWDEIAHLLPTPGWAGCSD